MESPSITLTSLDCLNFLCFIFVLLLCFLLLSLFLFDKSLFGLSDVLPLLGVAALSRDNVVSYLVHHCSSASMAKEVGSKSERFSLGKTENLLVVTFS